MLRKYMLMVSSFFLALIAFFKLSFYYHYQVKISASALFVIFETNASEASDFLSNYFDISVLFLLLIFIFPWIYFAINWNKKKSVYAIIDRRFKFNIYSVLLYISLFFSLLVSFRLIYSRFSEENILLSTYHSYKDYIKIKEGLQDRISQPFNSNIEICSYSEESQTHVVIIGESTSKWHMGLYGYKRNTNPLLSEIKDKLMVFDSVITPHVHTILALEKILTLSDYEEPNKKENLSIVQLANMTGFSTYWLSNQRPIGLHESVSTLIGYAANSKHFLATDNSGSEIYDENIFPVLDTILSGKEKKKMIFIHLMGTHSNYNKRYSEDFKHFKGVGPAIKFKNEKQ